VDQLEERPGEQAGSGEDLRQVPHGSGHRQQGNGQAGGGSAAEQGQSDGRRSQESGRELGVAGAALSVGQEYGTHLHRSSEQGRSRLEKNSTSR
jgi:hypothetical protein